LKIIILIKAFNLAICICVMTVLLGIQPVYPDGIPVPVGIGSASPTYNTPVIVDPDLVNFRQYELFFQLTVDPQELQEYLDSHVKAGEYQVGSAATIDLLAIIEEVENPDSNTSTQGGFESLAIVTVVTNNITSIDEQVVLAFYGDPGTAEAYNNLTVANVVRPASISYRVTDIDDLKDFDFQIDAEDGFSIKLRAEGISDILTDGPSLFGDFLNPSPFLTTFIDVDTNDLIRIEPAFLFLLETTGEYKVIPPKSKGKGKGKGDGLLLPGGVLPFSDVGGFTLINVELIWKRLP